MVAGHSSIEFRTIPLIDDDASTNVIELTDLNFDAMVNGSSDWMINLHSEWYVFQTSVDMESPLGGDVVEVWICSALLLDAEAIT